ncbi:MAG TPA: transglycosylase domain-containing protein, partial [Candidatus Saccharimonadales bacterium]|nr:transglycosylase domain-containing protein [Candidatus Saccharimonadales bacterium]
MSKNTGRKRGGSANTVTTRSGKTIKVNRTIADRKKARKAERNAAKAAYLASLPKERWKRWLFRLQPKHVFQYWFSREGGIMVLKIIGASVVVGFFLTIGLFAYFRKDLPQIKDLSGNLGGSISYYDSTGKVLLFTDYNSVKRQPVSSNQISPYMKDATVAIEDKNFYKEGAFDVRSIFRAAFHDLTGGSSLQGASTITEQLVKLDEGWTGQQSITVKVKEVILAVEMDRQYSKNDILTGYLNAAPYGGLDYGVQAAAEDYFQTNAANLTLAQASMLAAIPQAPSYYSPYAGPQYNSAVTDGTFSASALLARQHYILKQMQLQGYINATQEKTAEAVNVLSEVHPEQSLYQNIKAPYFVLAAKQQLIDKYGANTVAHGGWKVTTTLNMQLQQDAEQDVAKNAANVAAVNGDEEAVVAENVNNGQVVAQVGGENFNDPNYGQIDFSATKIQPG